MKKLILLFALSVIASVSQAYEGTPAKQVSLFFTEVAEGKISQAIDHLYVSNPIVMQRAQELTLLKQQLGNIEPLYGAFLGTEAVHFEQLSDSLVRIVQIVKYEQQPVTWEFYFYKPKQAWIVSQALFTDQFQVLDLKGKQ